MKPRTNSPSRVLILTLTILVLLNLAIFGWNARPLLEKRGVSIPFLAEQPVQTSRLTATSPPTATLTPLEPTDTAVPISMIDRGALVENLHAQGVLLLAMRDGNYIHLFAYHPLYLPLTRITNQPWNDIYPSLSPDGTRIAYSSRQNGYWDLYVLDLVSGKQERLTDTPEYEGASTWSPDGQWIAYEHYNGVSLDIYLQSLTDLAQPPLQLTNDPGIDSAPAWSPKGREIAFVSTRSGDEDIWLARLDNIDDRFINVSKSLQSQDRNPTWSADGSQLAWASNREGNHQIAIWDPDQFDHPARLVGEGDQAAWSPDGADIFSEVRDAQSSGIAAFKTQTGRLSMPLAPLPGSLFGMIWVKGQIVGWLAEKIENLDTTPAPVLWQPALTRTVVPAGRMGLVPLTDVTAPQPLLHDAVDEAFTALRSQISSEAGWDTLSSLENAYVPLTTPLTPSLQNDWLYTGRAFALNPLLQSAGWLVIAKDDFSGQVFWRVYLKARYQDGSMGMPLTSMVWDINARYNGDPQAYEAGGKPGQVPPGYWIDLTELAQRYGWMRLPSWINWRTFYPSIRYNQFVMSGGLDWSQAMAELYPAEAMRTATSVPTLTSTVSETSRTPARPVTATPTPTLTQLPTRRATFTSQSP